MESDIVSILTDFGVSVLFLVLFLRERALSTRIREEQIEDLRDCAGISKRITNSPTE